MNGNPEQCLLSKVPRTVPRKIQHLTPPEHLGQNSEKPRNGPTFNVAFMEYCQYISAVGLEASAPLLPFPFLFPFKGFWRLREAGRGNNTKHNIYIYIYIYIIG